jgi:pyruvate-formate lyase-activating enzyme
MPSKFFPIKTDTACQLKWNWSTIRLYNGTTSSCHRVDGDNISVDTFDQFHNTSKKLADRKLMLDGQWPMGGCEYCRNIEDAGGYSDRQLHSTIPNQSPPELEHDLTAIKVTPQIVEIYFDNVCNMSCLYCWDGFSSKIQQENIRFGPFEKQGIIIDNRAKKVSDINALTDKFWQWMRENGTKIRCLHILGGEPFYQKQFETCLDFFETHPCSDLELTVVSNLMVPDQKFQSLIQRLRDLVSRRHLARFDLTASIDCFGPEQEYVRYGLNIEQWKRNFEYACEQKWITLKINQTLSGLTIKNIPALLSYINTLRNNRRIGHYFSTTVMTHEFLHPEIFGAGFFDKDFDNILQCMPQDSQVQIVAQKYMQGIQSQLNSKSRDQTKINQLGIFLDEIDRRRNLDWRQTFPWLEKELQYVV